MLVIMRMTTFRKLLLIWMIAWLPLSGAMAAVMPFGADKAKGLVAAETMAMAATVDMADDSLTMPCHSQAKDGDQQSGQCNHCELCHLAGSIIPPALPQVEANTIHRLPPAFVRADFISFFPEQPQRPPLVSRT